MIRASLLSALLAGCVTETGNPELDVSLRVSAMSSDPAIEVPARPSGSVTDAWVNIGEVKLVESDTCDTVSEVEHTAEGPFLTDLLALAPEAIHIPAPATDFCRLRVRLDRDEGGSGAPAAMADHSVLLAGVRSDGVPFEVRSRREFELDLRTRGEAFALAEGADQVLLAFDLGAWLGAVALDDAEVADDGVARIDEEHEDDLLDDFEEAIEAALALFEDDDGDGEADDDEDVLAD